MHTIIMLLLGLSYLNFVDSVLIKEKAITPIH